MAVDDGRLSTLAVPFYRLLGTKEAAVLLKLSPRTLERLRVSGEGPRFLKAGPGKRARVLYRVEDLEAWLMQHSYASTSEYGAEHNGAKG